MTYKYNFVCDPNYITITAVNFPYILYNTKISFLINNKEVLAIRRGIPYDEDLEKIISEHVKQQCRYLTQMSENYIQQKYDANDIMGVLNIHRLLKTVRNKLGKIIWSRK